MVCVDVGMCTVWKDGVLKLSESSGRCECTLCAGGLVCVFVHLMVYLNPPPRFNSLSKLQSFSSFLHVACGVHVYFTNNPH